MTVPGGRSIVLVGFMGAGKSTAARSVAEADGLDWIDVDRVVEERLGRSIEDLFAAGDEAAFRAAEERVTVELLERRSAAVLALGGGAVMHRRVRDALRGQLVVWLDLPPQQAWARVAGTGRPLARDREQFARLYAEREPVYAELADVTVPASRAARMSAVLAAADGMPPAAKLLWAAAASRDHPVYVGAGLVTRHRYWPASVAGRRFLLSDSHVAPLFAEALEPVAARIVIGPGERSKTLAQAEAVWTGLAAAGMTRADVVVALGGGVVGDLAGFCAATYQRGVSCVQVPTSLIAQVDSAYGGKTGVDLAEGKNYVGAYHQPSAVLTDPDALKTLPQPELASGYAEVVKTALVAGGELWERIRAGANPTEPAIVQGCIRAKLRIVEQDERDAADREVLNLGHTVGHAIETATGYARYRHGEAVALGLLAALRLSGQPALRGEVAELLSRRGLPTRLDGADPEAVIAATARDKKCRGPNGVLFVLLDGPGRPRRGCEVDERELAGAVRELAR